MRLRRDALHQLRILSKSGSLNKPRKRAILLSDVLRLEILASSYQILPMDAICFREWGRIIERKPDERLEDAMIAATARGHHLVVATRNEADFQRLDVLILNPFKGS